MDMWWNIFMTYYEKHAIDIRLMEETRRTTELFSGSDRIPDCDLLAKVSSEGRGRDREKQEMQIFV